VQTPHMVAMMSANFKKVVTVTESMGAFRRADNILSSSSTARREDTTAYGNALMDPIH
jgi:hypothetical protein